MDAHGCGDAGVVNLNASDFALWNKAPPLGVDFGNVVQHGEDLDELFQPDLSFGGCQAETVFVEWPSADVPELRDILQENAFPLCREWSEPPCCMAPPTGILLDTKDQNVGINQESQFCAFWNYSRSYIFSRVMSSGLSTGRFLGKPLAIPEKARPFAHQ